jgi:hypothetical protein
MSRVLTVTAPRKDQFLTLRISQELRDALSVVAETSMRSMSSQALYYIRRGMEADMRVLQEKREDLGQELHSTLQNLVKTT